MYDVNTLVHIDEKEKQKVVEMSILNDSEILKKFITVLQ